MASQILPDGTRTVDGPTSGAVDDDPFTPEERAKMDAAREDKLRRQRAIAGMSTQAAQPATGGMQAYVATPEYAEAQRRKAMGGMYGMREMEAREAQMDALRLQRQAAMGMAPSAAQNLMGQGLDRAISGQQSMAASARGPAAMAMAQRQAAGNTARMQQEHTASMAALRAQEMANALQGYQAGASGMRAGDAQRYGTELGWSANKAQILRDADIAGSNQAVGHSGMVGNINRDDWQANIEFDKASRGASREESEQDQRRDERATAMAEQRLSNATKALGND